MFNGLHLLFMIMGILIGYYLGKTIEKEKHEQL